MSSQAHRPGAQATPSSAAIEGSGRDRLRVKLPCADLETVVRAGLRLRRRRPRAFADTTIFALPDAREGEHLRLRVRSSPEGAGADAASLTYKSGPRGVNGGSEQGEKIKVAVGQPNEMAKILRRLCLRRLFCYQRYRTVFFVYLKDGRTVRAKYDETPIGCFLKLDG